MPPGCYTPPIVVKKPMPGSKPKPKEGTKNTKPASASSTPGGKRDNKSGGEPARPKKPRNKGPSGDGKEGLGTTARTVLADIIGEQGQKQQGSKPNAPAPSEPSSQPQQQSQVDLTGDDSDDDGPPMNFANQRVSSVANLAPETYEVPQIWKDLADASPKKRPPLSAVFDPSEINPYTQKPLLDDVKRAIKIAKEIRDLPLDGIIHKCGSAYNNSSGSNDSTKEAITVNLLSLLVCCSCQTFGTKNWDSISISFLESRALQSGPAAMEFHQKWVVNLLIYILEYIFDRKYWRALYATIKYRNLKSARDYLTRASKLRFPLWSHGHIESGAFGRETADMMKGMNYHVAVLADKLVLGGLEARVKKHYQGDSHYLLPAEAAAMFKVNEGKRLWDAEMVSEKARPRQPDDADDA